MSVLIHTIDSLLMQTSPYQNSKFYLENETCSLCLHNLIETLAKYVRILKQVSLVFTNLLSNSPKCLPRFSLAYDGTENMFYFFYAITNNFLS